jgi:hypothetical protein
MIDLSKLNPVDAERIAYAEGFTGVSALYARLSNAEHLNHAQKLEIEDLRNTLIQCLPFFEDWEKENRADKPGNKTMDFMIRLIRKSLGEKPD